MSNKNQYNYLNPLTAKEKYMEEAFEYFKKREKLYSWLTLEYFNIHWKDKELKERWGAFRHAYTSAAFTQNFGNDLAKFYGDANEWKQVASIKPLNILKEGYIPGNTPKDRHMDLKNNAAGRKIANKNSGLKLLDEVYYALDNDPNIVLNQRINNDKPYNDTPIMNAVWKAADKSYENKDKVNNVLKGGIEYVKTISDTPKNVKEKLLRFREEKLARYTQKLAESPEKKAKIEAKHTTLEALKQPQQNRINRVHEMIANHEEKLKNKKSASLKKSNSRASGSGRWITIRGRHIYIGD